MWTSLRQNGVHVTVPPRAPKDSASRSNPLAAPSRDPPVSITRLQKPVRPVAVFRNTRGERHSMTPSQTATFVALLLTWWFTNNVYAIDAELLFRTFKSPHLYVDLTLTQTVLGILLSRFYASFYPAKPDAPRFTLPILAVGALHFLGNLLTNVSYALIGSTTTLMWKLSEPCSAIVLKRLVLQQATTATSVTGVLITISGVLLFSKSSFTIPNFSPIILSNIIFPARNVFVKLSQREYQSSAHRFLHMLTVALPLCLLTFLVKLAFFGANIEAVWYMLRNAMLFNAYQMASFLLLERLDALTHSLLNTLKRFTGILLSMIVISTPFHRHHYQGIAVTILGFCVYLAGGGKFRQKFGHNTFALAVIIGIAFMTLFGDPVSDALTSSQLRPLSLHTSSPGPPSVNSTTASKFVEQMSQDYIIMITDDYRNHQRNVKYQSYEAAFHDDGRNIGNLIWQYASHEALPDFSNTNICFRNEHNCQDMANDFNKKLVHYHPVASILNPLFPDTFSHFVKYMQKSDDHSVLMVGLGIQIEFELNATKPEFNTNGSITYTSDDYPIPPMTKQFFELMDERDCPLMMRGDFSNRLAQRGGVRKSYSAGCPSIWINHDVHLGRTLKSKYRAIAERVGDRSLKIAVNLKAVSGFEKQVAYIRDNYPNARFYCQGVPDLHFAQNNKIPFEKVRFFRDVEDWMADLREMDVAYGVRIHGNMVALGAGLPVIVVASDWRVLELVEVMKIPHFTTFDDVFENVDVAKLVKLKVDEFDGEEFDRNRCRIAKIYIDVFSRYGIGVRDHVRRVSELC